MLSFHVLFPIRFYFCFIPNFLSFSQHKNPFPSLIAWPAYPPGSSEFLQDQWPEFPWRCPIPCDLDWKWLKGDITWEKAHGWKQCATGSIEVTTRAHWPPPVQFPTLSLWGNVLFRLSPLLPWKDIYRYVTVKSMFLYIYKCINTHGSRFQF